MCGEPGVYQVSDTPTPFVGADFVATLRLGLEERTETGWRWRDGGITRQAMDWIFQRVLIATRPSRVGRELGRGGTAHQGCIRTLQIHGSGTLRFWNGGTLLSCIDLDCALDQVATENGAAVMVSSGRWR